MAITKILQIKRSHKQVLEYIMDVEKVTQVSNGQQQAIDYITNELKTNEGELVSGYNCDPSFSVAEFAMTQELARCVKGNYSKVGGADIKAHHVIQSFSPDDNVTPEQAHEIGQRMMQELLGGQHEFVLATHVDKEHIHNHVVFNATSFYTQTKFRCQPYKTAGQIRSISDKLCAEYGLSVLPEKQTLKSNYTQYQKYRTQTSYRVQLRKRLNFLIETEANLESFLSKAEELDVSVDLTGQHATYQFGSQKRRTRDDKLSDDGRFTKEGLKERLNENKELVTSLETEILTSASECETYDDFLHRLKEKMGVTVKKNRQGTVVFHFEGEASVRLPERAINKGLSLEKVKVAIRTNQPLSYESTLTTTKEAFDSQNQASVVDVDSPVLLSDDLIEEVTKKGLLIKAEDGTGKPGHIFIDTNHVDYLPKDQTYKIHLGPQYNYYFMEHGKQTNYFIKGETLLRQLETKLNVPTTKIEIDSKNIQSISAKGISLTFEKAGIHRLFLPKEYVHYDKLSKKVEVSVSDNWTYTFQKEASIKGKKKAPYHSLKGGKLLSVIQNEVPTLDVALTSQLNRFDIRLSLQESKELAGQLALLRRNHIKDIPGLNGKLLALDQQVSDTRISIEQLEETIKEYNQVAKYLIAYQSYRSTDSEAFFGGTEEPYSRKEKATMGAVAERELEKRGINPHVDVEKVIELVKDNQTQEKQLKVSLATAEKELAQYKEVKKLMTELNRHKLSPQQVKDRREEKER
ncbi:relaxase/mobilization nuclease domain-containing protein [Vagococcus salmoninarum]|uniref:relaxase/mobilization nuclease domain-containing protein n=1 Tax=Vagococcus salmoninarum TaxID=2739 RepID=UPI0028D3F634|nr:relaxase/mobilization nuclease domain-containing protein [Vagococcus salmoninarum]